MKTVFIVFLLLTQAGCSESQDWESSGYQDGYAATLNTVCRFRSTLIYGKYEDSDYTRGYSYGANAASLDVSTKGCERLK